MLEDLSNQGATRLIPVHMFTGDAKVISPQIIVYLKSIQTKPNENGVNAWAKLYKTNFHMARAWRRSISYVGLSFCPVL